MEDNRSRHKEIRQRRAEEEEQRLKTKKAEKEKEGKNLAQKGRKRLDKKS